MGKVKIFVCSHMPVDNILHDDVYTPIHLGRVNSIYKEEIAEYVGDDTGDNISEKGAHYSEGTAIYWIWKNCHDCEYVGLTQYRRQFVEHFTNENIDSFFKNGEDVILSSKKFRSHGRFFTVLTYMQMEDFLILRGVMKKLCPEYLPTLNRFLRDYVDHPFNMVVCKKSLYDKYAEWIFSICNEMEKYVKFSGYTNSARLMGYIIELLTPIYFLHNKYKIREMEVLFAGKLDRTSKIGKIRQFIKHNFKYPLLKDIPVGIDPSFYRGLNRDGIDLDCKY